MEARARKKFPTSPNFVFSAGGRVLSRGLCAMGAAGRKMRASTAPAPYARCILYIIASTASSPHPSPAAQSSPYALNARKSDRFPQNWQEPGGIPAHRL